MVNEVGKPKVSVLVPIYNVEKYLEQCLDSIIKQTLKEIEIICINDGSTDSSLEIVKKYSARDSRIIVIDKENSGYGASMNIGLKRASGDYVGIVESDDFAELNMFETLYAIAKKENLDVARSEFYYYDNNTKLDVKSDCSFSPQGKVIRPRDDLSIFYQQPSIWASIYRREFLMDNNIDFLETPGASYQDTSFTFKVYESAERYMMIDKPLIHYRTFAGSSSFVGNSKIYCVCDEYEEIEKRLRQKDDFESMSDLYMHLKFNAYRWNYYRLDNPYDLEFATRWRSEFQEALDEGILDLKSFRALDELEIRELLDTGLIRKGKPVLSVIIPVYNSEKYLSKCLDSVINQTLKDIEIICVNDGSTDSSRKILAEYQKNDKRIRIIDKKNGGLSSARNAGIEEASCEFICFLDSDDWVLPEAYEICLNNIMDSDMVIFGTKVVGDYREDIRDKDQWYYDVKYSGKVDLTDDIRLNVDVSAWDKIFRKKKIDELNLRFPPGKLYEDYYFYWNYVAHCNTAFFDKTYLHRYLRREGSLMDLTFKKSERAMEHLDILEGIFDNYSKDSDFHSHDERNISMFLNCFWFSYQYVPDKSKIKVMRKGTEIVKRFDLNGHRDIDNLKSGDYGLVDSSMSFTFKSRIMKKIVDKLEVWTGSDFSGIKASVRNNNPELKSNGPEYASTGWVQNHEIAYGIERWSLIYDSNSSNDVLNWDYKGGLQGGCEIMIPEHHSSVFLEGTELKVLATIWGAEVTVMRGVILNNSRFIIGSSFYDGTNVFVLSMDVLPEAKVISGRAICVNNGIDISENMKIIRIECRVY